MLLRELKRRKVTGVTIAYAVAAAGTIQLADIVAPRLNLPDQTVTFVILLALAGLPLAALLAWLYELVPDHGGAAERHAASASDAAAETAAARAAAALPLSATPFIGRVEELRELGVLLTTGTMRLITVTGPGGVGKTRLALEAARQIAHTFADGVVYRPLSGLASAEHLVPALAESLGVPLTRREDPLAELQSFLVEKELLLVLDNFEHITQAAGLLTPLLDHAPRLRMLVTSRERLNLQHETLVELRGLPVSDDAAASHAVQLFVAGARRLDRRFELNPANADDIVRICGLLAGIPLAIELASAWVRALSCAEIRAELEHGLGILSSETLDVDERHHSLRATFDASWRLLRADEQTTLARLAVFRSTFDSAAAVRVAESGMSVLRQLIDKSLLNREGERLLMLDVVRTFALDRLRADPVVERRAHERHCACFADLLHDMERRVRRAEPQAIARVAACIDDVRTAWLHALQTRDTGALLRMADALFHFYDARGWAREGAESFNRARTALGEEGGGDDARAVRLLAVKLDVRRGVFLQRLGDLRAAESLLRRAVAAARALRDSAETAFALHRLGTVRHGMGDYAEAEQLHQEAWSIARELEDRLAVGWSMTYVGNVAWSRGEYDAATRLYTEALELLRAEHDLNGMWVTLNNLGVIAASRHHYDEAQLRFREAAALQKDLGNARSGAHVLHNLGSAAREAGDHAAARRWLHESLEISERMGYQSMAGLTLVGIAQLELREGAQSTAAATIQRALRIAVAARNQPLALEALLTRAQLHGQQGDGGAAAELAAFVARHPSADRDVVRGATALLAELGVPLADTAETEDLNAVVERVLAEHAPAPRAGARRPPITQTAGEP